MGLNLFSFFHLNLAYSAIEEKDRIKVINKCYWPLLNVTRDLKVPIGIELSGYTLEIIEALDPKWINELKKLLSDGTCELIGSGYAQIIGPVVPAEVTKCNLKIGNKIYKKKLNLNPKIALINEQAFSKGLVSLYKEAGYEAIIMEWDNPYKENLKWVPEWRYLPQRAKGSENKNIKLIWNQSIGFQKFQRYVHGELELDEMKKYINSHKSKNSRLFSLYGNDVEIFDFRPGRYMSELDIHKSGEWKRIISLFKSLKKEKNIKFIKPSEIIKRNNKLNSNNLLDLTSAAQPIPVKKQNKYNILRWSVTGRDDLKINTICWKIFEILNYNLNLKIYNEEEWKKLCFLWSSDFRTHITAYRWTEYKKQLTRFLKKIKQKYFIKKIKQNKNSTENKIKKPKILQKGRFICIENSRYKIKFNCRRGLSIESFLDKKISNQPIFGTVQHGYFKDIEYGADYYSGHLVFEAPGKHKITDLNSIEPKIIKKRGQIILMGSINTILGKIKKKWIFNYQSGHLSLSYRINWSFPIIGSLRLGFITLIPKSFNKNIVYYKTHNGGMNMEKFKINKNQNFDHGKSISSLISANQGLSLTKNIIEFRDKKKGVMIETKKSQNAVVGLISNTRVDNENLYRLTFSVKELDDTSRPQPLDNLNITFKISTI